MKPSDFDKSTSDTILNQIHEGMRVCDNTGDEIGTVQRVFLGAVSDETNERGGGPATAPTTGWRDGNLIDYVARIFADDPLPEVLRERLVRHGFIHIDTSGLFTSDRFAMPDQIESISDDCVRLRLTKNELDKLIER